jgi:hypothetical protein
LSKGGFSAYTCINMKLRISFPLVFGTVALCIATAALAQSYSIPWYKVAGGGGTSTGGSYSLSGTIGQHDAGTMSGGSYSLTGGFWGIVNVIQTPGAPYLSILRGSNNSVVLSWLAPSSGFSLSSKPTITGTNWTAVNTNAHPVTVVNGSNSITLPIVGDQFFRLSNP